MWLTSVEQNMVATLRRLAKKANQTYHQFPRVEWILDNPAQLVVTVSQIQWCTEMERCLTSQYPTSELKTFLELNVSQLNDLTMVRCPL